MIIRPLACNSICPWLSTTDPKRINGLENLLVWFYNAPRVWPVFFQGLSAGEMPGYRRGLTSALA
jgi:hypothetical protein